MTIDPNAQPLQVRLGGVFEGYHGGQHALEVKLVHQVVHGIDAGVRADTGADHPGHRLDADLLLHLEPVIVEAVPVITEYAGLLLEVVAGAHDHGVTVDQVFPRRVRGLLHDDLGPGFAGAFGGGQHHLFGMTAERVVEE